LEDKMLTEIMDALYGAETLARTVPRIDPNDADDIRQQAALRICCCEPKIAVRKPLAYVAQAIRNCAIDHFRREGRRRCLGSDSLPDIQSSIDVQWGHAYEAIDRLPPKEREVVKRWMLGATIAQIATEDSVAPATVRKRFSRARQRISLMIDA
jgi:DNA-directed RNA polymerase specialized sigma24 family protein